MSLGVAVVGLGVGEAHARAFSAARQSHVLALNDLDAAKARRLAAAFPGARAASFDDLLSDPDVDVVSIASFDQDHFAQTRAALSAGKHVFVEKPLCRTEKELATLHSLWRKSGRHLESNLVLRAAPLYRWLKDAIARGTFGRLYAFDGEYLYGRLEKITSGWRKDVRNYSVFQGGAIHLLDLLLWTTGERPAAVSAVGNRIAAAGTAFRYDDYATATYEFPSGLIARVTANFGCVHRHQHVVRVFGTKATFFYDDRGARLYTSRDPRRAPRKIALDPLPPGKGALIAPFLRAAAAPRAHAGKSRHEFALASACLAADRALRTKKKERIRYL